MDKTSSTSMLLTVMLLMKSRVTRRVSSLFNWKKSKSITQNNSNTFHCITYGLESEYLFATVIKFES